MPNAIVVNSGGKDSLAAILLTKNDYELTSLYIDVGQRNTPSALPQAQATANAHCGGRHVTLTLSGANFLFVSDKIGITVAHQAAMFHSIAASYAIANGFTVVITGQRWGLPLTQPYFDAAVTALLNCSKFTTPPTILCPVGTLSDEDIWNVVKDDPLWQTTITCNEHPACGTCGRCKVRAQWLAR